MKKYGSLIALAVVVVLAIVVVVTRKKPVATVKAPYSIQKVEKLARIELTQPGEKGGLVVLALGDDGWKLTKPVDAPVADRLSDQIADALSKKINTDDMTLDASKLADYGLGDDAATKVALFAENAEVPATEFFLGKTFSVEGTRAKRTYIKTTDGKVFRAQTELGDILGKPVDELRSKTVQKLDRKAVSEIWVKYQDESKNLHLIKDGESWKLKEPAVDFELERTATNAIVNGVSNLVATGFVDDKKPAEVGLEPWFVKVVARETGGTEKILLVSQPADGKAYVKPEKGKHIYEIAATTAEQLAATPLSLRARLVKNITAADVKRVEFGGDDHVIAEKGSDGWKFVHGGKGKVKDSALMGKINAFAQLRALRFEPKSAQEAGLNHPAAEVSLTTNDGTKSTLLIGGDADDKGNLWAKWADSDLVMVVPKFIKERGAPSASELADTSS